LPAPAAQGLATTPAQVLRRVDLAPEVWDLIQESLRGVVESGTGRGCRIAGVEVAGKTGTAQNPNGEDHAWFIAYAFRPGEPPRIAIAVVVQYGGHGGQVAVPVARSVLEAFFAGHPQKTLAAEVGGNAGVER